MRLASINGRIYAMGGLNEVYPQRTVDVYEPNLDQWFPSPAMGTARTFHGVAVLDNFIYAVRVTHEDIQTDINLIMIFFIQVGGYDGSTSVDDGLNSVERYDPSTEEWRPLAVMNTQRSHVGVGVLNGFLYAVKLRRENQCGK